MYKAATQGIPKRKHIHKLIVLKPECEDQEAVARCIACDHIVLMEAGDIEKECTFSYDRQSSMKN